MSYRSPESPCGWDIRHTRPAALKCLDRAILRCGWYFPADNRRWSSNLPRTRPAPNIPRPARSRCRRHRTTDHRHSREHRHTSSFPRAGFHRERHTHCLSWEASYWLQFRVPHSRYRSLRTDNRSLLLLSDTRRASPELRNLIPRHRIRYPRSRFPVAWLVRSRSPTVRRRCRRSARRTRIRWHRTTTRVRRTPASSCRTQEHSCRRREFQCRRREHWCRMTTGWGTRSSVTHCCNPIHPLDCIRCVRRLFEPPGRRVSIAYRSPFASMRLPLACCWCCMVPWRSRRHRPSAECRNHIRSSARRTHSCRSCRESSRSWDSWPEPSPGLTPMTGRKADTEVRSLDGGFVGSRVPAIDDVDGFFLPQLTQLLTG